MSASDDWPDEFELCDDDESCGSCEVCGCDLTYDEAIDGLCGHCDWWGEQQ